MVRFLSSVSLVCIALCVSSIHTAYAYVDDTECLDLTDGYLCLSAESMSNSIRFSNTITDYTRSDIPQLSCDMQTPGGITLQRNTCDATINQDGNGDYRIYVTFNTDQATFIYNSNTRRFTSAVE